MPTLSCNLKCLYCFNRLKGLKKPDITSFTPEQLAEKAIAYAKITNHNEVVLHGGEPLLWGLNNISRFIDLVTKAGLKVGIQTNGVIITEKHVELFRRYNVNVGVSIDGDPDIGFTRGIYKEDGTPISHEINVNIVKKVMKNIELMVKNKVSVGVIVVLHKYNFGDDEKIDKLANFLKWLKKIGVNDVRLNPGFAFGKIESWELSWQDLLHGYITLWYKIRDLNLNISPYTDISNALLGNLRDTVCWFHGCGFWDTIVYTILPNGKLAPCDRVLWYGMYPLRDLDSPIMQSRLRVLALLQTELKNSKNGHLHKGGCPAESPDGDWRRASRFWRVWDELIDFMAYEILKVNPRLKLTNRYENKLEFIEKIDSGCAWNIWTGEIVCQK